MMMMERKQERIMPQNNHDNVTSTVASSTYTYCSAREALCVNVVFVPENFILIIVSVNVRM